MKNSFSSRNAYLDFDICPLCGFRDYVKNEEEEIGFCFHCLVRIDLRPTLENDLQALAEVFHTVWLDAGVAANQFAEALSNIFRR